MISDASLYLGIQYTLDLFKTHTCFFVFDVVPTWVDIKSFSLFAHDMCDLRVFIGYCVISFYHG